MITIKASFDTGAKETILDTDLVEQIMMPSVTKENRRELESAYGSLVKRSGTVQVKQVNLAVPDTSSGKPKILDLVTEIVCLEPRVTV